MYFSTEYQELGIDSPEHIREVIASKRPPQFSYRRMPTGARVLIRSGIVYDEKEKPRLPYYVAIGRNLSKGEDLLRSFTTTQMWLIPVMAVAGCILGWIMAGLTLRPVLAVAQTAQRITGSNLSLRIPARGAGDELDYLILTLNRMIERLESSFQQIRQFSTDVSHELRTPITAIRGQLEVAMFTAKTPEQYQEAILNSLQDIERLSQIVRALLLLSQAESGQVVLQKQRLDLASTVREIVDQFQIPAEEQRVQLVSSLPAECTIDADRVQIERMLSNLLSNAVKFTPAGGRVRVLLHNDGDEVELVVEDTGCGIPSEALPYIFERFYRVRGKEDASSPEKGLGLGLSFVAWIVKAHGGEIHVESQPGSGSRFVVRLPAATSSPVLAPAASLSS
jgi:heavy metal sensor kinase